MSDHDFEFVGPAPPERHAEQDLRPMADLARILDLKTALSPPLLGPRLEDFVEWKEQFQNIMTPLAIEDLLEAAVALPFEVDLDECTERNKIIARLLHMLIVPCVKGNAKAAMVVRGVPNKNGWVAWRRLCQEFQPRDTDRWAAIEAGLLSPQWTSANFVDQLREWKDDVARYEVESGRYIPDHIKVSVITRWAPPHIRYFIRLTPAAATASLQSLETAICNYERRGRIYTARGTPQMGASESVPMEIGVVESGPPMRWKSRAQKSFEQQQWNGSKGKAGKGGGWRQAQWWQNRPPQAQISGREPAASFWWTGVGNVGGQWPRTSEESETPSGGKSKGKDKGKMKGKKGKKGKKGEKGGGKTFGKPGLKGSLKGSSKGKTPPVCYRCGAAGHYASQCQLAAWDLEEMPEESGYDFAQVWDPSWQDEDEQAQEDWTQEVCEDDADQSLQWQACWQELQEQLTNLEEDLEADETCLAATDEQDNQDQMEPDVDDDIVEFGVDTCASVSVCPLKFGGDRVERVRKQPKTVPMVTAKKGQKIQRTGWHRRMQLNFTENSELQGPLLPIEMEERMCIDHFWP